MMNEIQLSYEPSAKRAKLGDNHEEPTTRPPTQERMLSSDSDSTARPHAERTDAELQSIVSTAQAEIDQRKAERLQLQEERREFEATRKRLAETEAELDKRAAKQQRQTGHTNSEDSTSNHQDQDQDQDGVAEPATAESPLRTIAAHTTTPRTALSTVAAATLAQPVATVAAAAHLQPTAEPSAAVTQPAAAQPAGMDIDALAVALGVVPVQTTTAAAAAPTVHDLTESARVTPSASGNVLSFKDLVAQLAKDPTLSSSVKRQIYELGEAYRVQDKVSFFGKLEELVGKELFKRALLALRAAPSITGAATVSCSSSHAAPFAAMKPVRKKQKRKASHVLVGPDVLLKEHVECARVDGTTVVRATRNGGASSYAIEEMD